MREVQWGGSGGMMARPEPLEALAVSVSVTCAKCRGTVAFPDTHAGRRETCPHCGAAVDMPGTPPAPAPAADRPSPPEQDGGTGPRRLCPSCHGPLPRGRSRCPSCGALYALAKSEQRLSRHDGMHGVQMDRVTRSWGVWGGVLLIVAAVAWFVLGLAAGYVFFYPPVLLLMGFLSIVSGVASARRRKRLAMRRARREAQ